MRSIALLLVTSGASVVAAAACNGEDSEETPDIRPLDLDDYPDDVEVSSGTSDLGDGAVADGGVADGSRDGDAAGGAGWTRLLGTGARDGATAVATDGAGDVYIAGRTRGDLGSQVNAGGSDGFLAKFDATGTRQWLRLFGTSDHDRAAAVTTDGSGNVYIAGSTNGGFGGEANAGRADVYVAKFDGGGMRQWVRQLGTPEDEDAVSLATNEAGAAYVVGETLGDLAGETNAGGKDGYVAKFGAFGTREWVQLLGTTENDRGLSVAVDNSGAFYVAGKTFGDLGGEKHAGRRDGFVAKYDLDGMRQWVRLLGTSAIEDATAVATNDSGEVYVAGHSSGDLGTQTNAGNLDGFVAMFDAAGARDWVRLFGSSDRELVKSIAWDGSNHLHVVGRTKGDLGGRTSTGSEDRFAVTYKTDGTYESIRQLGALTNGLHRPTKVATDGPGAVYVAGSTWSDLGGETHAAKGDAFLMRLP